MEYVRDPIEYKTECLVNDRPYKKNNRKNKKQSIEDQLMELDIQNMIEQSAEEYEIKMINEILLKEQEENEKKKKLEESKTILTGLLNKLKRITRHDVEIEYIHSILLPIVEMYFSGSIDEYNIDSYTYDRIIRGLKSVRITTQEYELMFRILKSK